MPEHPPLCCGIDPGGSSGGIAFIGEGFATAYSMPDTEKEIWDLLREHKPSITRVFMESQHPFPGMSSVAMGKFMKHYGFLRGVLVALEIPFIDVSPQKWKKALGITLSKDDSKTEKKKLSKQLAEQWYPGIKITHATSEALLIAAYGRRIAL